MEIFVTLNAAQVAVWFTKSNMCRLYYGLFVTSRGLKAVMMDLSGICDQQTV
jgi:hypothetical protein